MFESASKVRGMFSQLRCAVKVGEMAAQPAQRLYDHLLTKLGGIGYSNAWRSAQNVYHQLKADKELPYDVDTDVFIGCHTKNGDCEISFGDFKPERDSLDSSFERIGYFRTMDTMLWNTESGIDTVFYSGNTESKLKQNPNATDVSMENLNNLPSFVRCLVIGKWKRNTKRRSSFEVDESETTVSDDSGSSDAQSSGTGSKDDRYTHFLSIRIDNPLLIKLGAHLQVHSLFAILTLFVSTFCLIEISKTERYCSCL